MPTTTNFGWTTPADTDLVKDGAAAIRTFAGNVDTSLVDLKGGTTGQYLQKNSGTDLDYVWADVSAGGMTLISTTTLTGASVSLTSIPQTYNQLRLVVRNFLPTTDNRSCVIQFNSDTGANYRSVQFGDLAGESFTDSNIVLLKNNDNTVDKSLGVLDIFDYTNTTSWKIALGTGFTVNSTTTTNFNGMNGGAVWNNTAAISSITVTTSGGNFTSGTALLYGVK